AGLTVELAETEVAVSHERAHAELRGQGQRLAVERFGVPNAAGRGDLTGEAEGVSLCPTSREPAAERQGLSGVAPGLVELPGREVGHPRAQRDERRSGVIPPTMDSLDGASHQREPLLRPVGKDVGCTEGCGVERREYDKLPRSVEVEALLEERGRAWEIPATE